MAPRRRARRAPRRRTATAYWPLAIAEVAIAVLLAMTLPGVESQYRWHDGLDYDASTGSPR